MPKSGLQTERFAALRFFLCRSAFCALREGLDSADTKKFPEEIYGKANQKNKDRYLAISKAYAARGAKMDSVDAVLNGQLARAVRCQLVTRN